MKKEDLFQTLDSAELACAHVMAPESLTIAKDRLAEIRDIIYDYDLQAEQLQAMVLKYDRINRPAKVGIDRYLCPSCNCRVNPHHTYCHWCGKRIGR